MLLGIAQIAVDILYLVGGRIFDFIAVIMDTIASMFFV